MEFSPSYPAVPYREYMELPPACHHILSDGYEIHPSLVAKVRAQSFSGRKDECPYAYLQTFEENCSLLIIPSMTQTHFMVEVIPILSDGRSQDLVQPDGKESRRRLDTVEG